MNIGASGGGSGKYWCAFGVAQQQWGLGSPSINFPIAFPKECFIAAITRAAGNYEHSIVITTKNKTNLSWICKGYDNSAGNTYANWLALGCQLQWRNNPGLWAIPFTEFVAGGITMTRTGSQSSGTWYGDSGTISLTGYTASCATNESWVSNISGSAIAVGL